MMEDKSGIYSLAGFAYQIKIFALQIPRLRDGEYVGYEIVDDVAVKTSRESIDDVDSACTYALRDGVFKAIQVKNTLVRSQDAKRIVMNWLSATIEKQSIGKYVLVTSKTETDDDILNNVSFEEIYNDIFFKSVKKRSLEAKLRNVNLTRDEFKKYFDEIISKSEVNIISDSESSIVESYKDFFIFDGVTEYTYFKRLEQFLMEITSELLNVIQSGSCYKIDYQRIQKMRNHYIISITDEKYDPSFSNFKRIMKIDLDKLAQLKTREYQQLCECKGLDDEMIIQNLLLGEFYADCRSYYFDLGKQNIPEAIEETAYSNFCDVKAYLRARNEDTPDNRLHDTKEKTNTNAQNDEIRKGVCINLTSNQTPIDLRISWRD